MRDTQYYRSGGDGYGWLGITVLTCAVSIFVYFNFINPEKLLELRGRSIPEAITNSAMAKVSSNNNEISKQDSDWLGGLINERIKESSEK